MTGCATLPRQPGSVVVWLADLDLLGSRQLGWLNPQEQDRRATMHQPADRARFALGAAMVRGLGSALSGSDPQTVEVERDCPQCGGPHGRPRLLGGVNLSLTHSGQWVALAAGWEPLGVDIEQVRVLDHLALAEDVLSPGERDLFDREDFYRRWTAKEAYLKALGVGLAAPMSQVELGFDALGVPASARLLPAGVAAQVVALPLAAGYLGALASTDPAHLQVRMGSPAELLDR